MGRNIIVSEETVRDLLEAHASLSAWYYQLWGGLRAVNASVHPPDDAARAAFVERLATDFPEIAAVARAIRVPRMYVPQPPAYLAAPPQAQAATEPSAREAEPAPPPVELSPPAPPAPPAIAPPPMVVPSTVKYGP